MDGSESGSGEVFDVERIRRLVELMKEHDLSSIVDIGCGSAYKLLKYLGDYDTIGIEMPQTYEWLYENFPDRKWLVSDFAMQEKLSSDLIICADVIEHLVDPDELIDFIKGISFRYLILSTPDRNLVYHPSERGFLGPPRNPSHQREWTFDEFHEYISMHFDIIEHEVTNAAQWTQMIVCVPGEKTV